MVVRHFKCLLACGRNHQFHDFFLTSSCSSSSIAFCSDFLEELVADFLTNVLVLDVFQLARTGMH